MEKKIKIKQCPFCKKNTARRILVKEVYNNYPLSLIYYICSSCGEYEESKDENDKLKEKVDKLQNVMNKLKFM